MNIAQSILTGRASLGFDHPHDPAFIALKRQVDSLHPHVRFNRGAVWAACDSIPVLIDTEPDPDATWDDPAVKTVSTSVRVDADGNPFVPHTTDAMRKADSDFWSRVFDESLTPHTVDGHLVWTRLTAFLSALSAPISH